MDKLNHINKNNLVLWLDYSYENYSIINRSACLLLISILLASSVQAKSKITIDGDNQAAAVSRSLSKLEYESSLNDVAIDRLDSIAIKANSEPTAPNQKLDLNPLNNSKPVFSFAGLAGRSSIELLNVETVESDLVSSGSNLALNSELSLPDLVKIGLNYSPVMQQAQASFESAEAQANIARSELLPSISARHSEGPESSESKGSTDGHTYQVSSFRLTQPIFNAALIKDYMGSNKNQDAAELRLHANRETTALATIRATTDLAAARLILSFSDDLLQQLGKILSYLETRASAGASSQAELERARTRVFSARQTRIEQQTNYRNALLEVVRLTGVTPKKIELPAIEQYPKLPATNAELHQQVLEANYDLRSLRRDVDAQQDSVHREYGKLMPIIGVSLERDQSTNVRGTHNRFRLITARYW